MQRRGNAVNSQVRLRFQKGDMLAVALVVLLAVATVFCFLPKEENTVCVAEVYRDGELVQTLDLGEDQSVVIDGKYRNTVTISGGTVAITASDCPGEDCVHSGAIQASGRSIVCLPNGVEVRVVGASADVDFVVG